MEELVKQEKYEAHQQRVADWIGSQGVLFQFRYARTVGAQSILKQLGSLLVKFAMIAAVLAGVGFLLLEKHFWSDSYEAKMNLEVEDALGVSVIETKEFSRSRGNGEYSGLELEGGDRSFFYHSEIEGLSAPLSYFTGVGAKWKPDFIKMERAEFSLKAGGGAQEMKDAYAGVLESLTKEGVTSLLIEDFSCDWGYSKLTYGQIANTRFRADLENKKWIVSIAGGTFQQNWLRDLEITEGRLIIDESGIDVSSLNFVQSGGEMTLVGKIGGPLDTPQFSLSGDFKDLRVENLIRLDGIAVSDYVEGQISGELKISGSTNQRIKIAGVASLANEKFLTIREKWPLLRAMSIIDTQRSYRRINFSEGSFNFSTVDGCMTVSNLDLLAPDTAKLKGEFSTHLPTQQEAAESLGIKLTDGFSEDSTDTSAAQELEDERMSLSSALRESGRMDDLNFNRSQNGSMRNDSDPGLNSKELEGLRLREEMKVHRITGELKIAIPASSFAENKNLSRSYPSDSEGWRWIDIQLQDTSFREISQTANEEFLDQARMKNSDANEADELQ